MKNYTHKTKSRALLGYGKWKPTLILIGLLLGMGGMKMMAQSDAPDGLHMKKTFTPTADDGSEGYITLETYVTGASVTVSKSIPSEQRPKEICGIASSHKSIRSSLGR